MRTTSPRSKPGRFIVFEGPDGVGKSTQAALLAQRLDVVLTREPGGTAIGTRIRALLLDRATEGLSARSEALLMAADRAQHVAECVRPALAAGRHVVGDRYLYSSVAYQGYGRGLPPEEIRGLSLWAADGLQPDMVVLLDGPCRLAGAGDRLEDEDDDFRARVAAGYRAQAEADPGLWVYVDASGGVAQTALAVRAAVGDRLGLGDVTGEAGDVDDAAAAEPPGPEPSGPDGDALATVAGQPEALALLRASLDRPVHAYLFVGPRGAGKRQAARAFAAELLAAGRVGDDAARHRRLALAETHPDLEVVEREGASISRDQIRHVVEQAVRSPVEGDRKILLLTEFHLVVDAAPILLKSVEEPPPSTVFLILADEVPPELVTIASRCVVVRFQPLRTEEVIDVLVAEGIEPDAAARAADAAGGDLERARILTADPGLEARAAAWRSLPERLDGRGSTVGALVGGLTAQLDDALAPLDVRHRAELADLEERIERYGLPRGALKTTEDRHKRERRRFRTDEVRFGLAVLARACRDRLAAQLTPAAAPAGSSGRLGPAAFEPLAAVQAAAEALDRNPNETLLLEALLLRLRPLE